MMLTIFFMLLGLSNAGINNFGVAALMSCYGVELAAANFALTAFLRHQRRGRAGRRLSGRPHRAPRPGRGGLFRHQRSDHACHRDGLTAAAAADGADDRSRLPRRRDRALAWDMLVRNAALPVRPGEPSASSPPDSISAAFWRRCCSAGSWTRTAALPAGRLGRLHGPDCAVGAGQWILQAISSNEHLPQA